MHRPTFSRLVVAVVRIGQDVLQSVNYYQRSEIHLYYSQCFLQKTVAPTTQPTICPYHASRRIFTVLKDGKQ